MACDHRVEGTDVQGAQALGLLESGPKLAGDLDLREVEERPADAGDRDPVDESPVFGMLPADVVAANPRNGVARRGGDVNQATPDGPEVLEGGSIAVAEQRPRPASENRRHPAPTDCQVRVAHGVDAAMDAVQAATGGAVVDGVLRVPQPPKLRGGHHPVLASGQLRETCVA